MPTITITEVPDAVYERLEARAKDAGESLSDYLLAELTTLARRPTPKRCASASPPWSRSNSPNRRPRRSARSAPSATASSCVEILEVVRVLRSSGSALVREQVVKGLRDGRLSAPAEAARSLRRHKPSIACTTSPGSALPAYTSASTSPHRTARTPSPPKTPSDPAGTSTADHRCRKDPAPAQGAHPPSPIIGSPPGQRLAQPASGPPPRKTRAAQKQAPPSKRTRRLK